MMFVLPPEHDPPGASFRVGMFRVLVTDLSGGHVAVLWPGHVLKFNHTTSAIPAP
jgi:hypothetical protein